MVVEQPRRVLIADDDPEIRGLLAAVLRQRGLTVDVASDGREAIDLIAEASFAVIILDLLMPRVDGFGVIDHLRGRDGGPMPVVLVVSGAEPRVIDALDPRVIHGIIHKPFDAHELANLVEACAEIRSRSAFETMAITAMLAGGPLISWLSRMT
jgi:DNA-binding response OmpR family regulator